MMFIVIQRLVIEFILDFLYFPIWWYTNGLKRFVFTSIEQFKIANISLAPGLWIKNILVPMFGQRDWQGRIMSFFMRLVNIIFRGIALGLYGVLLSVLLVLWCLFPLFVATMFIFSLMLI